MIYKPKCLKVGDTVGVVAPSDAVDRDDMQKSLEIIRSWGLKVKMGKHIYAKVGDFMAGTAEERQEDLLDMINDPEVRVVWAATGGYAATEVMSIFNREVMEKLKGDPKWFVGYSDVCIILNALTSYNIASLMGPSVWGLYEWDEESRAVIKDMVFGAEVVGIGPGYKWKGEVVGSAEGRIVAADLETLILSFGTRFDPIMYGSGPIILALEELDIEKSTLQRQIDVILSHKRATRIAGVLVGRLVNIRELSYPEWGKDITAQELVAKRVRKWGKAAVPMAFMEDFGHAEWDYENISEEDKARANHKFLTIPNGIKAKLTVGQNACQLEYLEAICEDNSINHGDSDKKPIRV